MLGNAFGRRVDPGKGRVLVEVLPVQRRGGVAHDLLEQMKIHHHFDLIKPRRFHFHDRTPTVGMWRFHRPVVQTQGVRGVKRALNA